MYQFDVLKETYGKMALYDQLIQVDQIIRQEKWMNEAGYINDQEWNEYNLVIKDFNKLVLNDVQYKLIS